MDAMEQILQFQDSVPCKIRAKRGCATHPRSIAERVRRTRISERMRKLQELVPNMDKQTNTADMLDLAVEYIKKLQSEAKVLKQNPNYLIQLALIYLFCSILSQACFSCRPSRIVKQAVPVQASNSQTQLLQCNFAV
eukprot:TRINITY_DN5294_c0_g1_i5.p1 TRINITY_DN5294_c0_g1~~TRINITY_DN5294_c0_g1_i5.p1  ORF type:complete len:160 (-),score=19.32 TRINITY_DN5294_c0_g1_i5:482-892(-)